MPAARNIVKDCPPPRPVPPQVLGVCDGCNKPWGTCWCRTIFAGMLASPIVAALIAFLLFCSGAFGEDIGLVVGQPEEAVRNSERWNKAWAAKPPKIVTLPCGRIFIADTIKTQAVDGCATLETSGAGGYTVGGHPGMTGARSIVIKKGKSDAFRLCGSGLDSHNPFELEKPDGGDGIVVEGRDSASGGGGIATGRHRIQNIVFVGCDNCIVTKAGYYKENGDFVSYEAHADNSLVESCEAFDCKTFFRSENQQAVNWTFRTLRINGSGTVVADLKRGGNVIIDDLVGNDPKMTIFKVEDYSPNTCDLVCRGLRVDRFAGQEFWTCLFYYDGPPIDPRYPPQWRISIDGACQVYQTKFNKSKCYKVPLGFVLDKSRVSVAGVNR